jgi:alpha-beta hydrolase superfamily lysophospholipase
MPVHALYLDCTSNKGFEQLTIHQPNDYEGEVVCTLLRRKTDLASDKAILYVHGFNDYFFNDWLAGQFINEGYHFYALDLRKCGRSWLPHQKFNNLRHISEYMEDIDAALSQMADEGIENVLLYGHSMGGLLTAYYASKNPHHKMLRAVVLNSPFFEMNEDWFTRNILLHLTSFLAKWFPNVLVPGGFSKFYGPSLHQSAYGEWDYNLDWKPHIMPKVNMGWTRAIFRCQQEAQQGLEIKQPVLVLYPEKSVYGRKWKKEFSEADAVLKVESIRKFSRKIQGDCTLMQLENAMHDVMLSKKPVRERAFKQLIAWSGKYF